MKLCRAALTLSLLLLFHGCAQTPVTESSDSAQGVVVAAPTSTDMALQQLGSMTVNEANHLAVNWARDYLGNGRLDAARTMLDWVKPKQLSPSQLVQWAQLSGQLLLADQKPDEALALLDRKDVQAAENQVSDAEAATLLLLRADALTLKGDLLSSLILRVNADAKLPVEKSNYNRQMIWTQLMLMPASQLEDARKTHKEYLVSGWLELASLYRDPLTDIDTQIHSFDQWQAQWPNHPAAENLPGMIQALRKAVKDRPQTIAVMLPMNGPLAAAASAVRDGLMTAYYSALSQGYPVPRILFYDSSSDDIINLYNQATAAGAQLVIGPLDKDQVGRLASADSLPVPTLALNYVDQAVTPAQLYQFGLAPEDEARQAAQQAIIEGARLAAVLYPEGDWGARVAEAFRAHFEELGGIVTTRTAYGKDATAATRAMLDLGQSQGRARALQRYTSLTIEFEPRRRQDIDMVFMVASAAQARQLKPALNFNYASDVPVFSTSQVYGGTPSASTDGDLNGIRFVDVPWLLDQDSPLHKDAFAVWQGGHGRYERLFAMGVDAYRLHARLGMLQSVPDSFLPGVTGQLSVGDERRLQRQLQWAYFSSGIPKRMPVVSGTGVEAVGSAVVAPATR